MAYFLVKKYLCQLEPSIKNESNPAKFFTQDNKKASKSLQN